MADGTWKELMVPALRKYPDVTKGRFVGMCSEHDDARLCFNVKSTELVMLPVLVQV